MAQHTQDPDAPKNQLNAHHTEAQQKSEDQPNDNQPKPDDQQNAEDQPEPETWHNPEDQPNEKTPKRARAPGGNGVYCNKRMVRGMVHFLGRRVELRTGSGSVLRGALTAVGPLMDIELQQVRCVSSPRKDVDTTRLRDAMVFGWKDMASVCLLNEDDESEQPAETTVEDKTGSEPQRGDTSQQHGQYESEADGSEHQGGDTTEEELSVKSSDASGLVAYCVKEVCDIEYSVSEAGISEQEIDYYHATDNWEQEDEQQDGKHETQSDKLEKQANDQQQSGHEPDPDNLEKRGDEQQQSSPQQSEENRSVSESHSKQQTNVVREQQHDVVSNASKQAGDEESGRKRSDPECTEEPRVEKFTFLTDETSLDASGKAVIQAESVDGGERVSGDGVAKKVKDQGDVEEKESDGAAATKVKNQGDVEEKESDDGVATKTKDQGDVEEKESDDAAAKKVKDQGYVEEKESDDDVATKTKDQGDVEEKESDDGVATKVKDQGDGRQKESADSATSVVEEEAERVVGVKEQQTAEPAQHTDLNASKKLEQQAGREKPHVTESEAQSISTQQASLHLLDTPETQANDVTKHKKPSDVSESKPETESNVIEEKLSDVSESGPKTENITEESKLSDVSQSKPKTESNVTKESKLSDVSQSKPKTESNVTEESKLSDVTQSKPKTESNVTEESKLSDVTQSKPKPESNVTEEKPANIDMSKPDTKRDVTEEWKETDFDVLSQSETGASNVTKETERAGVDVSNKPDTKRDVTEDWKETDIDGRREPETRTSDVTKEMEQADARVSNKPETQSALTDEKEDTSVGVPKEPNASHATEEEEPTNMEVSQQVEEEAEKMEERNRTEKQQADRAATPKQVQQPKVEGWWHGTPLQKRREMLTPLLGTKVRVTKVFGSVYEGKYCGLTSSNILQLSDVMLVPPGGQADSGEVLHSVGLGGDSIDDIQPVNMKELESYYDSEDEADDSSDCHLESENSSGWDVKEMLDSIPTKSDEDFYDKYGLSRPAEFKSKEECEAVETLAIQIANEIQGSEGFAQRVHWEEMLEEGSESEQTKGNPDRRGDEEGPEWL